MKKQHYQDCQFLYKKMLFTLDKPLTNDSSQYYLKNLKETEACDYIKDFSKIRQDVNDYIQDCHDLQLKNTIEKQTVIHYKTWHRINILDGLSYYNRYYYHYKNLTNELYKVYKNIFK